MTGHTIDDELAAIGALIATQQALADTDSVAAMYEDDGSDTPSESLPGSESEPTHSSPREGSKAAEVLGGANVPARSSSLQRASASPRCVGAASKSVQTKVAEERSEAAPTHPKAADGSAISSSSSGLDDVVSGVDEPSAPAMYDEREAMLIAAFSTAVALGYAGERLARGAAWASAGKTQHVLDLTYRQAEALTVQMIRNAELEGLK